MKELVFLCSLPRAGNTVISSILNQNKHIKVSPNSITANILYNLISLKGTEIFQNFPNHRSLDNVIASVLPTYYQDWDADIIIDRGTWGTPFNLNLIKNFIKNPKFILLVRPIVECAASFAKLQMDNGYSKKEACDFVNNSLEEDKILGRSIISISNIIKNNENYKIFYYKDFCNNPENFFKDLSNYLNTEIKYNFDKIEPFNVNGIYYNDEIIGLKNLHYIYSGKPKEEIYDVDNYLTNDIIDKIQKIEHESFANTKNN